MIRVASSARRGFTCTVAVRGAPKLAHTAHPTGTAAESRPGGVAASSPWATTGVTGSDSGGLFALAGLALVGPPEPRVVSGKGVLF